MEKALETGGVEGFSIWREEILVSHQQFADDTLFLLRASLSNIRKVNALLKFHTLCSGLKINIGKGTLVGINTRVCGCFVL